METRFKYKLDRRSRRITWCIAIVVILLFTGFHFLWGADYLPAWIIGFIICVIALYILSIPRFISVSDDALEVHCVIELTRIHIEDVEIVKHIDRHYFNKLIPLIGSYGFGGYYGYYFNFNEWNICKVYAAERKNLVLIEDIYEDLYIVSCSDPDALVSLTTIARDKKRQEIFNHTSQDNNT